MKSLTTIAITFLFISCAEPQQQPASDSEITLSDSLKSSTMPDQESEGAQIILYRGERISTEIHAEKIWKFTAKDSTIAQELEVFFYDTSGTIANHLTSDSGVILETKKIMIAIGNVIAISSDSTVLYTEELIWNDQTELITSDEYVTIISKTDTIRGVGFKADRDLRSIKILKQVEGSLSGSNQSGADN